MPFKRKKILPIKSVSAGMESGSCLSTSTLAELAATNVTVHTTEFSHVTFS